MTVSSNKLQIIEKMGILGKNQNINFYHVNICVLNHHLLLGLERDRVAVFEV
jgi:hypothetical protein